jgi:hypothetical protein
VPWRLQCPKCRRQTFVEGAAASIRHSFWARVYSQQQRDQGQAHQAAVRALAFKWLRILGRCWQERPPYDESVYLKALNSRGSSLIHNLAKESKIPSKHLDSPPQGMCSVRPAGVECLCRNSRSTSSWAAAASR